ncbi:MAG: hypothetical protein ACE5Q6_14705, partial [Dehalococcoidia bacterium]
GETLFWGMAYGTFWWFLGPLTLLPIIRGFAPAWDLALAQERFPLLLGHVLYGSILGLLLVLLQWQRRVQDGTLQLSAGSLVRGTLAGILAASLLGWALAAQNRLEPLAGLISGDSVGVAWLLTLALGLVAGLGFALLYPKPTDSAGADLIRGLIYGFFFWVVGVLTVVPLLGGAGLIWSLTGIREIFPTFAGFLLFGAAIALFYQVLGDLVELLFADIVGSSIDEGVGIVGLRVVGRSALAGLAGGLIFSLVMWQTGFLKYVAGLVGEHSAVTGFVVHLVIAVLVGTSYGILFRQQSYDLGSALGWGVSYGFFWAILGPITLMPILLGGAPQWTPGAVAGAFPNLIGHLAYGAGLGVVYYLLQARDNPWWIPRTEMQATQVARRKDQLLTSAPALWTLVVIIGLTMPILLVP